MTLKKKKNNNTFLVTQLLKSKKFPFKRGRLALNSRPDVEMCALHTERGGEVEKRRGDPPEWSRAHMSHTPNFPK